MTMSLLIPVLLIVGLSIAAIIFWKPFWGLVLIIIINQFDEYIGYLFGNVSLGRVVGILVFAGWFINTFLRRKSKVFLHKNLNITLIVYASVVLMSALMSIHPEVGFKQAFTIILLVMMNMFIQDFIESRKDLERLIWVIAIAYGLSGFVGLFQYYTGSYGGEIIGTYHQYGDDESMRFAGLRGNPNGYGMVIMSGIPFLFYIIRKYKGVIQRGIYIAILLAALFSLFLTVSRTHIFGFFVFLSVYLYYLNKSSKRKLPGILLGVLVIVSVVVYVQVLPEYVINRIVESSPDVDTSSQARLILFHKGIALFEENPILGVGIGNARFFGPLLGMGMHDTIACTLGETGAVGAIALVILLLQTFLKQRTILKGAKPAWSGGIREITIIVHAAFIAFIVTTFGNVVVYQRMFWTYIAITAVLQKAAEYGIGDPVVEPVAVAPAEPEPRPPQQGDALPPGVPASPEAS